MFAPRTYQCRGHQITHIPKEILLLPKLRYLNLKNNSITSLPSIQAPSLEYLFLSENQIDAIPMQLLQSPKLKKVTLTKHEHTDSTLRISYK